MRKISILLIVMILIALILTLNAQKTSNLPRNQQQLADLSTKLRIRSQQQRQIAEQWAKKNDVPIRKEFPSGRIIEIQQLMYNRPRYYITDNLNAAKTVSTDDVWPGGSAGLSLTGNGMVVGEWDGGKVRNTHQEFGGRVSQMDNAVQTSSHSTHVGGTLIASGVEHNAKGMAGSANLHAYDWNDDEAEMANAASNGLIISNHSYSYITGWVHDYRGDGKWAWFGDPSISETEDYYFGFYIDQSRLWDEIAYQAPYYLIVKSAGNDRNDEGPGPGESHWVYDPTNGWVLSTVTREPDGGADGFDCIPGGGATAKNTLTVGAVKDIISGYSQISDVRMTAFSSWGPTDDGRIKPDIVGNGKSLYSCDDDNDQDYIRYSGTSMASPNVAGSLLLLQEHYKNTHDGQLMRAATLKALVIHTADEAGASPGPDYSYGWGLLNTRKAADVISADAQDTSVIQELTLVQGDSAEFFVQANGTEPLRVTIAWTDPPGTVPSPQLNPRTPVLVNDLNVRVIRLSDSTAFYPWKLSPEHPEAPAQTGDNNVDPEEQVLIDDPGQNNFKIVVSHAGNLADNLQNYSMIVTGASFSHECHAPYIKVGDVSGVTGDTIKVPILIEQNSIPIDAFGFKFDYCSEKLSFIGVEAATLTSDFEFLDAQENTAGTVNVGGFDPTAIPENSSGTLLYLKLVVEQCIEGESCILYMKNLTDDIAGVNICAGTFSCEPGCELGDVNMDGDITPGDALCAFQIYLEGGSAPQGECDTICAMTAADANCDNDVTPGDALLIFQAYINGLKPPLDCPPMKAFDDDEGIANIQLVQLPAADSDEIKIAIRLDNSAALSHLGMDLGFQSDKLKFKSATLGKTAQLWEAFACNEILDGVLRIGGFTHEPQKVSRDENLMILTFEKVEKGSKKNEIWAYNGKGNIKIAQTEMFTMNESEFILEKSNSEVKEFSLGQNFPNPFNNETKITFSVDKAAFISIKIYNIQGQLIKTLVEENKSAGNYQINWDGRDEDGKDAVSGIYFVQMKANEIKLIQKVTLLR